MLAGITVRWQKQKHPRKGTCNESNLLSLLEKNLALLGDGKCNHLGGGGGGVGGENRRMDMFFET